MLSSVLFLLLPSLSLSLVTQEMTVEVPAGQEECFFESVLSGQILDVDYQVVDGGRQNELEINFRVLKPDGVPLVADFRKSDNTHRQTVGEAGDYKICFDNTMSRFSSKIVFFEIIIENEGEEDAVDPLGDMYRKGGAFEEQGEETYDVQVQDIQEALKVIHEKVSKSRHFQDQIRNHEFRDRSIAERNFERVNFWSTVHLVSMLAAGLAQVVLVRSLFDEKSTLYSIWKRVC